MKYVKKIFLILFLVFILYSYFCCRIVLRSNKEGEKCGKETANRTR
jgi:cell division protein FtsI/penicillin-binding protein 2